MEKKLLGKYVEGDSWLHRIAPQLKIIIAMIFSVITIVFSQLDFLIFINFIIFVVVKTSKISLSDFFSGIKPLLYIIVFTLFFQLFFTTGGEQILNFGIVKIYSKALENILVVLFRFLILVGMAFLLTYTTSPIEITHGLEDIFSPLKKIGVPVKEFALILSIALRFIPVFFNEVERIKIGQASKGLEIDELNYIEKMKNYAHIIIPLLFSALKRGEELADAMEIKGYSLKNKKTRLRYYKIERKDLYFITGSFFIIVVCIMRNI
ncbi:MAG: energy-coupling factor transporter transmembrane component T family protein [Fusobacteriaceae bacterium]